MDETLKLLTAHDLAELWQMDPSTIYRMMKSGEIPTVKFARCVRVTPADAAEFIQSRRKWQSCIIQPLNIRRKWQRRINQPVNPN